MLLASAEAGRAAAARWGHFGCMSASQPWCCSIRDRASSGRCGGMLSQSGAANSLDGVRGCSKADECLHRRGRLVPRAISRDLRQGLNGA
mmetsp:Transcript_68362/g.198039  ORF Transcript_68362/g.198039 Transcript_68362/m.198039 type:complete len:90 (-) Transcript_68362:21-290(-)